MGVTAFWGYGQYTEKQKLETYLGNNYQRSFYEMVSDVEQIQILLGKCLVSSSQSQNIVNLTDIWKNSMSAQSRLTELPIAAPVVLRTTKYLSQTGDYCHVLAKDNAEGKVLTAEDRKQLIKLRAQAGELSDALHELESEILDGRVSWSEIIRGTRSKIAKETDTKLNSNFDDIKEDMNEFPTLIYDGPFSDHITQTKPKGVQGKKITREKAREKALNIIDVENKGDLEVVDTRTITGKLPAYNVQVENDNNSYSVDFSQKGGFPVNMISTRDVENSKIDLDEAAEKGKDYLAKIGYANMNPTYSEKKGNIAFISYAYQNENITFYPDIINVQIALDNGQVTAIEALSYLMSHRERNIEEPKLNESEVRDLVGGRFDKIDNIRLAVIPTDSMKEILTYEVKAQIGKETYLVYINAINGIEEQILKLVKNKNGSFTI